MRVRAANAVHHTTSLVAMEPQWGSRIHQVADGWLVLAGRGMYINQAMAAGLRVDLAAADVDLVVTASGDLGVPAAIEITPATSADTVRQVVAAGFDHDPGADIACLTRPLNQTSIDAPDDVLVVPATSAADLVHWQATARAAWGHTSNAARRASDAFAAAAHALDREHMAIARDAGDGRTLGCASMTVTDGVAMCGGMSTLPDERRRGVQAALLHYRLALAAELECDMAVTTAARGSASERNLRRHGFSGDVTIRRFERTA